MTAPDPQDAYRFFVPDLAAGAVDLPQAEAHHAAHVLRLRPGEAVELFDGRGGLARGRIRSVKRSDVWVEVTDRPERLVRPAPVVHLACAVPKGKRLDWLLEKATELAAASLRPVVFERSVAGEEELSEHKHQRWQQHCVAAAKQSGLNFLPELTAPAGVEELARQAGEAGWLALAGDLTDDCVTLRQALAAWQAPREILLLVGPEGGLTDAERQTLAGRGFAPVRLGRTTLRIETAAVALLAGTAACVE